MLFCMLGALCRSGCAPIRSARAASAAAQAGGAGAWPHAQRGRRGRPAARQPAPRDALLRVLRAQPRLGHRRPDGAVSTIEITYALSILKHVRMAAHRYYNSGRSLRYMYMRLVVVIYL